jgi:hypothetical protein
MRRYLSMSRRVEFGVRACCRGWNRLFYSWSLCTKVRAGSFLHSGWDRRRGGVPFAVSDSSRHTCTDTGHTKWVHRADIQRALALLRHWHTWDLI